MNIAKNMEFVFIIAVALTCATAFAATPAKTVAPQLVSANPAKMIVITVTGKRLSAAQKAQLGA